MNSCPTSSSTCAGTGPHGQHRAGHGGVHLPVLHAADGARRSTGLQSAERLAPGDAPRGEPGLHAAARLQGAHRQPCPGVKRVATASGSTALPGKKRAGRLDELYQDPTRTSSRTSRSRPRYLAIYPEYMLPPDQSRRFLPDRRGCVIGRGLADSSAGRSATPSSSRAPSRRTAWRDGPFEFMVRAIYDADLVRHPGTDLNQMFFHYKYLDEATGQRLGAGTYVVEIDDPAQAAESARRSTPSSRTATRRPRPRPRRPSRPASSRWPATWHCCSTPSASP